MTEHEQYQPRRRLPLVALAVLLVLVGTVAVLVAVRAQKHAPQPPASAAIPLVTTTSSASAVPPTSSKPRGTAKPTPVTHGPILARSIPVSISLPSIGVSSDLLELGLNPDHSVQVPPLAKDSKAGWYDQSPTPGQLGPSVILGHVDSAEYGAAVFFKLGAMRPGDPIEVRRADHTDAVFRVDKVVSYPKNTFPTFEVYGNTDNAALRLITCGGKFDFSTRNYLNNIVVYASLVSSHPV